MKEENIISIEQAALAFLLQARKDAGMSEEQFGRLAFPESERPRTKIHAMWSVQTSNTKGLRLRLGDFCSMCKALGKNPAQELLLLWNQIEQD